MMTGSVVVPIKAVLMNILSLGASFGAMVWIFQEGHLSGLLGFDSVGALDLWMPVLILIFAFGLSMDYEVFLLSRIKEVHDQTGDNDLAVAVGLQRSGRIITSAAALIVVVFAGFAAGEVLAVKQLGVGLAIAVIVDATLVRTLLVPATMKLLGERNWWAPAPLRRFHDRYGLHEAPSAPRPPRDGPGAGDRGRGGWRSPDEPPRRLRHRPGRQPPRRPAGRWRPRGRRRQPERAPAVRRRDQRAGDATDATFTTAVCAGADVVYFCLDAPDYHRWPEQFPPLQHGVLAGARAAGARLVVLENLYGYGPVNGRELDETLPLAATSAKGRTRAAMTQGCSTPTSRDRRGRHRPGVGLLRPGATHSALGELVFATARRASRPRSWATPTGPTATRTRPTWPPA